MEPVEQNSKELKKPAHRFSPPSELRLVARTMGSTLKYEIPVANMSQTGLLLEWKRLKPSLPFLENTLIEMELTATLLDQQRVINIMGKVTRRDASERGTVYGVRIIHNDDREQFAWTDLITRYEQMVLAA